VLILTSAYQKVSSKIEEYLIIKKSFFFARVFIERFYSSIALHQSIDIPLAN
jgi:hypothetical protein